MNEPRPGPSHVLVRVWLPDRPGALGLVASRIGAMRGDIIGVDVLERGLDVAVDEFAVELPDLDLLNLLVKEVEEVDGASVEEVRIVAAFPDPRLDALESAADLCEAADVAELRARLVESARREFLTDWGALLSAGEIVESVGEVEPSVDMLGALAAGVAASPMVAGGETGPDDLALARVPGRDAILFLGRTGRPFRRRERAQLFAITRIAARAWQLLPAGVT
ncbi:MAG: hypothetical protein ACXW2C_08510 [Acidimicrobiia bacterium]